ncbi:MAG: alpha/beta hydrolase [Anaerolineae bacterium]|jgi:pimeloyl-ACP methyl ester carboxylesterase|nr:alpha/beta hydrolase [Anaerolineae bacterium]
MPFANNQGTKIHYETEGYGTPLVLQYGQYFPMDIWYELNYVRAMKDDCRLILVDARGHGDSDKPLDPAAYRIEVMAHDIVSVLDKLGLEKAHYMGYSSGGALGFALARYAPGRCSSLILGGTYPYACPDDGSWHTERIETLEKQTTADFVAGLEGFLSSQGFPPLSPRMRGSMLKHDTHALVAWHRAALEMAELSFEDVLGSISVPCLLYAGENSEEYALAQKAAQAIPGASFVGIPNGGHLEGGTWIDLLRPHLRRTVSNA